MAYLGKTYTSYKHENFDGFLKHVGVPDDKIDAITSVPAVQKLEKDGDSYIITMNTPGGEKRDTFQSGVEFDDVIGLDKTPIKNKIVVDGNTVMQTIKAADKGAATFKKEYNGDDLTVTITVEGWNGVAKRYYKATN